MTDLISRADAIEAVRGLSVLVDEDEDFSYFEEALKALPSADADGEDLIIKGAKGIQDGLYNIKDGKLFKYKANGGTVRTYPIVPSADADADAYTRITGLMPDAVPIHNDGTLEVKVPNAQKVGRVLVMDTDSHIGGGLFYPNDAAQGEWKHTITWQPYCSNCEYVFGEDEEFSPFWNYCPMCGARMKGGAE